MEITFSYPPVLLRVTPLVSWNRLIFLFPLQGRMLFQGVALRLIAHANNDVARQADCADDDDKGDDQFNDEQNSYRCKTHNLTPPF